MVVAEQDLPSPVDEINQDPRRFSLRADPWQRRETIDHLEPPTQRDARPVEGDRRNGEGRPDVQ